MEDRELLELAAKAADITITRWGGLYGAFIEKGQSWSPLTDDGDALRLAVKLKLDIAQGVGHLIAGDILYPRSGDPAVDTRRAIVVAAAEIGRAM
ncbi:UNVERIFIED_ORG: hypothetical protein LHK14_14505 [Roseateles sp. XES5]|nr:hypothetical protein [Roseateles sp. XES5]